MHDVSCIVETYEDWTTHCGENLNGAFAGLDSWSGLLIQVRDGNHLMLVNPAHSHTRRTLTIAHEFGHLTLGHRPVIIESDVGMRENRYSDEQEREATAYGEPSSCPMLRYFRCSARARQYVGLRITTV
jgi:IrrE N-terminal-like domain